MKFLLKNEIQRKIFVNATSLIIAIIAFLLFTRVNDIYAFLGRTFDVLLPFILGFGIAFILAGPVSWVENRLMRFKMKKGTRRLAATSVVFLLAVLIVYLSLYVFIPSLTDSLKVFMENFSVYSERTEEWVLNMAAQLNLNQEDIKSFFQNMDLVKSLNSFLTNSLSQAIPYSLSFIRTLSNLVISIAAAFYMLLYKEVLIRTWKTLMYAILSNQQANFLTLYSMDAKNVFHQYIIGNILDSTIIGLICWISILLLRIPYAPMIAFVVGVTNVIPVFGPFLGAIPVIILLLMINPMYALIFAIFILILQQIDGNVLKPIILGDKLGINGFWILFSVSVGGSLFGIPGMFLGVPVFALIYEAVNDLIEIRLNQKNLTIPESFGVIPAQKKKTDLVE